MYTVLIKNDDGTTLEQNWTAEAVEKLVLPVDNLALAPRDVSDRPRTKKEAYTLTYRVQPAIKIDLPDNDEEAEDGSAEPTPEPEWSSYGTTSPQALAIALIAWIVGLGLRNMLTSGSPLICSAVNGTGSKSNGRWAQLASPTKAVEVVKPHRVAKQVVKTVAVVAKPCSVILVDLCGGLPSDKGFDVVAPTNLEL